MEKDSIAPRSGQKESPEQTMQSPSVITDAGLCELWRNLKKMARKERRLRKCQTKQN